MKIYLSFVILLISLLISCKKDTVDARSSLVIGKWSFLPTVNQLYTNGSLSSTSTQQYEITDYVEFKKDGTFEAKSDGRFAVYPYRIDGDTIIFDNRNKAKIKTVTSTSLSYYFTDTVNASVYRITTFNYRK